MQYELLVAMQLSHAVSCTDVICTPLCRRAKAVLCHGLDCSVRQAELRVNRIGSLQPTPGRCPGCDSTDRVMAAHVERCTTPDCKVRGP